MYITIFLMTIWCMPIACQCLQHGVDNELAEIREELRKQGELTGALTQLVHDQNARIAKQVMTIESQAKRIGDLENINSLLEEVSSTRYDDLNSADEVNVNKTSSKRDEAVNAGKVRPRVKERAALAEGPVAFQAGVHGDLNHIGINQKIIFDDVKLSIGNGFHSQFGLFVAPKAGLYIFSVTILANKDKDVEVLLKKNGAVVGGAYGNSIGEVDFDQGSITAVVQLAIGDEVYVDNAWPNDTSIRGAWQSNFMGCLIMAL